LDIAGITGETKVSTASGVEVEDGVYVEEVKDGFAYGGGRGGGSNYWGGEEEGQEDEEGRLDNGFH